MLKICQTSLHLLQFAILILFLAGASPSHAVQIEHQIVRRLVVFPFQAPPKLAAKADETWWQVRQELSQNQIFLLASKQFLAKNEALQARGELQPSDAILLGKLLDAHALVTAVINEHTFTMTVYDASFGLMLWQNHIEMQVSRPIEDQIVEAGKKLAHDFLSSIPYQGFQVIDSLRGKATFEDNDEVRTEVQINPQSGIQVGDIVQWIHLYHKTTDPLFQGGGDMKAFAEGKVVLIDKGIATVQLIRATSLNEIKEYTLVRFPKEAERLKLEYSLKDPLPGKLSTAIIETPEDKMKSVAKERRPLVTTLSFVGSIAAILLLAF
jgi:hypothetical protein